MELRKTLVIVDGAGSESKYVSLEGSPNDSMLEFAKRKVSRDTGVAVENLTAKFPGMSAEADQDGSSK